MSTGHLNVNPKALKRKGEGKLLIMSLHLYTFMCIDASINCYLTAFILSRYFINITPFNYYPFTTKKLHYGKPGSKQL